MNKSPFAAVTEHVGFSWFAMVMGLCGLSLAWAQVRGPWRLVAEQVSVGLGFLAGGVLALLMWAMMWRCLRFPAAVLSDVRHPVNHVFVATVPASWVLLATVWVKHRGYSPWAETLWMLGALGLLLVTLGVMWRWLQPDLTAENFWKGMTPALFIPVVGNVLPALAGVSLGHPVWVTAQFGVAAVLWPVMMALMVVRIGMVGLWPERMLPSTFITIAPPSVLALSGQQLAVPDAVVHMLWGVSLFFTWVCMTLLHRCLRQPFGMPFWSLSFPLAASAALSLQMVSNQSVAHVVALWWLLAVSGAIAALLLATLWGLLKGRLLLPEHPLPVVALPPQAR